MAGTAGAIRAGRAFVELFADKSALVRGLKAAEKDLRNFGQNVGDLGRKLLTIGTVAATPFALSTVVFANFEQQMASVQARTQATGEEFKQLNELAKKLGRDTVFTATDAAQAMAFFASAGFNVRRILEATTPTLNLAAAGQLSMAESATVVARVMENMGIGAEGLGHAVDVLAVSMNKAITTLPELGDAFKHAGALARFGGQSFEETTAALLIMSKALGSGEMAGTSLRGMLAALTAPSEKAAGALAELGFHVADATGKIFPLSVMIQQLEASLKDLPQEKQLQLLGDIFDTKQITGALALVSAGSATFRQLVAELKNADGTAKRMADTLLNTLLGSWNLFTSSLEGVAISIGESLVVPLRFVAKTLQQFTEDLRTWMDANRGVVEGTAGTIAGVIALGSAMIAASAGVKLLAFALGFLKTPIGLVYTTLSTLLSVISFAVSPIGIVTSAVVLLGASIISGTERGRAGLTMLATAFQTVKQIALATWGGISSALSRGDLMAAAQIAWAGIKLSFLEGQAGVLAALKAWKISVIETFIELDREVLLAMNEMWGKSANATKDFVDTWGMGLRIVGDKLDGFLTEIEKFGATAGIKLQHALRAGLGGEGAMGSAAMAARRAVTDPIDKARKARHDQMLTDFDKIESDRRNRLKDDPTAKARDKINAAADKLIDASRDSAVAGAEAAAAAIKSARDELNKLLEPSHLPPEPDETPEEQMRRLGISNPPPLVIPELPELPPAIEKLTKAALDLPRSMSDGSQEAVETIQRSMMGDRQNAVQQQQLEEARLIRRLNEELLNEARKESTGTHVVLAPANF